MLDGIGVSGGGLLQAMFESTAPWVIDDSMAEPVETRLTRDRLLLVLSLSILLAVVRLFAMAAGPWDWDEALFTLAVGGDYDVALHHPHPPGFPLYIGAAKLIAPLSGNFEALQIIVFISAVALFPLMFFVAIEMGFGYRPSIVAGILLASFPNVVFFGGSGFSDVPSLALTLASVLLFMRGRRSKHSFVAASLMAGVAAGVRIQAVLSCTMPALLAMRRRRVREVALGLATGAIVVGLAYGSAAVATGSLERYGSAVRHHGEYIRTTDSFESPTRPPLGEVFERVLRPWKAGDLAGVTLFFAGIALVDLLVNRHAPSAIALGTFGPFLVFAWLMLDPNSMSRFSIGFMPLHALLAARGISVTASMLSPWLRLSELSCAAFLSAVLTISLLGWVKDPVAAVRVDPSPPMAAMDWVRANLPAEDAVIWVESPTLGAFADLALDDREVRRFEKWSDIDTSGTEGKRGWILVEGRHDDATVSFRRTERHLRQIVRDRYFEVSIVALDSTVLFGDGWYGQEGSRGRWWRWMAGTAEVEVPASPFARDLQLVLEYPSDTLNAATMSIDLDGTSLDLPARPIGGTSDVVIPLQAGSRHHLQISVTPTVRPVDVGSSGDPRVLGARLVACDLRQSSVLSTSGLSVGASQTYP